MSCDPAPAIHKGSISETPAIKISSPSNLARINNFDSAAVVVSGKCENEGENIYVESSSIHQVTTCSGGVFSATLNFSSFSDGIYQIIAGNLNYTTSIKISLITDSAQSVIFNDPVTPTYLFQDSFTMTWLTHGSLRSTDSYFVEAYANAGCTGTPFDDGFQDNADYDFTGMIAGVSYSLRVKAFSEDDIESIATCSQLVSYDPTGPSLALYDGTTLSSTYVRQIITAATIGTSNLAKKYCLSATITTVPLITNACFKISKPTTVTFSTGDGLKTAYLWVADTYGNVLATATTQTITLDTTLPATAVSVISHPTSLSTTETNQALNDLTITVDTDANSWCVVEEAATVLTMTKPLFSDACWVGARPTSITLGGTGSRRAFIFTKDLAENVSDASTATINYLEATKFTMTFTEATTNVCNPIDVDLFDDNGDPAIAGDLGYIITLSLDGTGKLYSNPGCTASLNSITVTAGEEFTRFYYKGTSVASVDITGTYASDASETHLITLDVKNRTMMNLSDEGTACVIQNEALQCWGLNNGTYFAKNLGTDLYPELSVPSLSPSFSSLVTDLSVGSDHGCIIHNSVVKCFGQGDSGQIGNNSLVSKTVPTTVTGASSLAFQVTSGHKYSCAIINGAAKCWGLNDQGQLGSGNLLTKTSAFQVSGLTSNVYQIEASRNFTCAIVKRVLKCWGDNSYGQLGDGTTTDRLTPTDVSLMLADVTDISLAKTWGCGIKAGAVYCWGTSPVAGLGEGTLVSSTPVAASVLTAGVTEISVADDHACALMAGDLYCWGKNDYGQFGDGTTSLIVTTTPTANLAISNLVTLSSRPYATCGVTSASAVQCWGGNHHNILGIAEFNESSVPFTIPGLTGTPLALSAGSTNCVTMTDNSVQCWGRGDEYQIGDSSNISRAVPTTSTVTGSSQISTGQYSTCTITASLVNCWGTNLNLRLGQDVSVTESATGLDVQGVVATATQVSVSPTGSHACAVVNGGVMCWGTAAFGRLGIPYVNAEEDTASYVTGIGAASGATKVVTGNAHSCALIGTAVKCWGKNTNGQLGNSSTTNSFSPVTAIATGATDISSGGDYNCGVVSGALYCWGVSRYFEAGYVGQRNSPTVHTSLTSNVSKVSAGGIHTCVILVSGAVNCFGSSSNGRLGAGYGLAAATASPKPALGITAASDISATDTHTCAIDGATVKCWGRSHYGAISEGGTFATATPVTPLFYPSPTSLQLSSVTTTFTGCIEFEIILQDVGGVELNATSNMTVSLHDTTAGSFFTANDCLSGGTTTATITSGTSRVSVYYTTPTPTQASVSVRALGAISNTFTVGSY